MMVSAALIAAATEAAEETTELPLPAWAFAIVAGVVFFALFLLTWAFRNVSNNH